MHLLVDGVFFQLADAGIAGVWRSLLPRLAKSMQITLLDRGGAPEIPGAASIPFPAYTASDTAAESILIERLCRFYRADIFTSTYYSTPLTTPMLLIIYDMIPEVTGFDLRVRDSREKELAILYSRRRVCISENTRADLLKRYPEICPESVSVARCAVDGEVFRPLEEQDIRRFRREHGLPAPFFICVGLRGTYKNAQVFFDAVASLADADFDIVLAGGERVSVDNIKTAAGQRVVVRQVTYSDHELALAYNAAEALILPSLYEGFDMPAADAMACGCPVITTHCGSLKEVAGDAPLVVPGASVPEMVAAMREVRNPSVRARHRAAGLLQAQRFSWDEMAEKVLVQLRELHAESTRGVHDAFFRRWSELRRLQADVDF